MKEKWRHIFDNKSCPSSEVLQKYLKDTLSPDERFAAENHIAGCEICNDLVEGMMLVKDKDAIETAEKEIAGRLSELLKRKKKPDVPVIYRRLAIAASILLLMGTGLTIYFYTINIQPQLAGSSIEKSTDQQKLSDSSVMAQKMPEIVERSAMAINKPGAVKIEKRREVSPQSAGQLAFIEEAEVISEDDKMNEAIYTETKEGDSENVANEKMDIIENKQFTQQEMMFAGKSASPKSGKRIIKGKVTGMKGEKLPGANVQLKGEPKGVITDLDGNFEIEIPDTTAVLTFKYIGYLSSEEKAGNKSTLDVELAEDLMALDEVVVVGYGTQKKVTTTGAVSKLTYEQLNNLPPENAEQSLQEKTDREILRRTSSEGADVEQNQEILSQIDSLKNVLKINNQDIATIRALIEKYLEIHYKADALAELNALKNQTTDSVKVNTINEIIRLTKEEKYNKAIKMLQEFTL